MGWFGIVNVPTLNPNEVTRRNYKYIDSSSSRVSQIFNNTWLSRYPRPRKFMLDNGSEFKLDVTTLIKDYNIKPVLMTIKNPQYHASVERVHQVIFNMPDTKDPD